MTKKERQKKYYLANKQKFADRGKKRYLENPTYFKEYNLIRKYGMTLKEWNQLFNKQQGCCAICGVHQSELKNKLQVDHEHPSGKIRKLLCSNCNISFGLVKEDIKILENMIKYLEAD